MKNPFFKNNGPFKIDILLKRASIGNSENFKKDKVFDIKDLFSATKNDLTFFHSSNYSSLASITKASYCITSKNLSHFLPKSCKKIIVDNVLLSIANITKEFYPNSINDDFDDTVKDITKTSLKRKCKHGKNILVGKNMNRMLCTTHGITPQNTG